MGHPAPSTQGFEFHGFESSEIDERAHYFWQIGTSANRNIPAHERPARCRRYTRAGAPAPHKEVKIRAQEWVALDHLFQATGCAAELRPAG